MGFTSLNLDAYKNKMQNNFFPDSDWTSIYKTKNLSLTQVFPQMNKNIKMNIIFKTNIGRTINLVIEPEKTISELIQKFFERIGELELYNRKDSFYFIHQAQIIDYYDKTKIINYFKGSQNPVIFVNDIANLIGAKYYNY